MSEEKKRIEKIEYPVLKLDIEELVLDPNNPRFDKPESMKVPREKYDDIEVPDSYKPVLQKAAKAKVPRTQVCARYTRFNGEYNRSCYTDVLFSKQNYMYEGIENLINQGHTIVYGSMEEEEDLRQIAFVMTALPEWRSRDKFNTMHMQNIHVHKIANSHMKYYKTLGALTIKEFIINHS